MSLMATTTWKPASADALLDPATRAANNRLASMTTAGRGPTKAFTQLPPLMQSALVAMKSHSKLIQ